jgi:hypothetical protein
MLTLGIMMKNLRTKPRELIQWWESNFYIATELFLLPLLKKDTFHPLPIYPYNSSVTVTSYKFFKCNEIVPSYYKK